MSLYGQVQPVVVKFAYEPNIEILEQLNIKKADLEPLFFWHKYNSKLQNSRLANIYAIQAQSISEQTQLLKKLAKVKGVLYAEVKPEVALFETTNDPLTASQYYLSQIRINEAWDISQGDSSIVIGIVDTGTDFTHEDLDGKVALNRNDPVNGVDDDLDGFIDNYYGWDLSENNNNPQADINGHGVRVAGIAAAATNNEIGIAGVGNKVRFLPVKTMDSEGHLNTAWEGIVYAADHGANVIVCSWGGVVPTQFGKDIIDYATYDRNALIVAAAGNSGNMDIYYPASYPEVLSVAASNINDQKWSSSTYGHTIDLCAPGASIYATVLGNGYGSGNGTSFAAPSVGAVAAIIKYQRPHLSAMQIKQQLINSTYFLDTIPQNVIYAKKLGSGRLDAFAALTDTMISGLELSNFITHGTAMPTDTVSITGLINNHLQSAAVTIEISSRTEYATILNPNINAGIIHSNNFYTITNNQLKVKLSSNTPHDHEVTIQFALNDGIKTRYRFFSFIANQSWIDVTENNLNMTVGANGRLGFNSLSPIQGNGIWLENMKNMVWDAGIIHGNSPSQTLSTFYNSPPFDIISGNTPTEMPEWSFTTKAIMTDTNRDNSMNLSIHQIAQTADDPELNNVMFFDWMYVNKSEDNYDNFRAGVFFDWDLNDASKNIMYFDETNNIAICKSIDENIFVGVEVFKKPFHHYAFELTEDTDGINITDNFTTEEQWFALSNERANAGGEQGNDVAHLVSIDEESLNAGDTLHFQIILAVAFHEQNLINSIINAENHLNNITDINSTFYHSAKIYPNPTKNEISVICDSEIKTISIFNLSGTSLYEAHPNALETKIRVNIPNGLYIVKIESQNGDITYSKVIVQN